MVCPDSVRPDASVMVTLGGVRLGDVIKDLAIMIAPLLLVLVAIIMLPGVFLEPVSWVESAGTGEVYSYSIHYIGPSKAYKGDPPHTVALIDLVSSRLRFAIIGQPAAKA